MPIISGGTSGSASVSGASSLIYRFTVAASDKTSIDTTTDVAQAGSNDWTNGDLLEIFASIRTDDAAASSLPFFQFNNDSGANYDREVIRANNVTASAVNAVAGTSLVFNAHGSGGTANYASTAVLAIPNFTGTTFFKAGTIVEAVVDGTAGNNFSEAWAVGWRSATAITRVLLSAAAGQKLKVGSQLLVYKRSS